MILGYGFRSLDFCGIAGGRQRSGNPAKGRKFLAIGLYHGAKSGNVGKPPHPTTDTNAQPPMPAYPRLTMGPAGSSRIMQ